MKNIKIFILNAVSTTYFLIIYGLMSYNYINFFSTVDRPDILWSYYYNVGYYFLFAIIILVLATIFKRKYMVIINIITILMILGDFIFSIFSSMSG